MAGDAGTALLMLYDEALPAVYGYLLSRCGQAAVAQDLTGETFLAAVDAVRRDTPVRMTTGWLVGVARHKLADHWRRQAREDRGLRAVADVPGAWPMTRGTSAWTPYAPALSWRSWDRITGRR